MKLSRDSRLYLVVVPRTETMAECTRTSSERARRSVVHGIAPYTAFCGINCDVHRKVMRCELVRRSQRGYTRGRTTLSSSPEATETARGKQRRSLFALRGRLENHRLGRFNLLFERYHASI